MKNYFYTEAALPTLRFGEKAPVSEEEFLQFTEATMGARDYQVLLKSRWGLTEPTGLPLADRILSWEKELRLELAKTRILRHKLDFAPTLPASEGNDSLVEQVRAAMALDSPLDAERFLDRLRWSFLEDVGACHFFDVGSLVVYYLKLQLVLRQEKFREELGRESFEKVYAAVTESFNKITQ